jgi:hypothetical protein
MTEWIAPWDYDTPPVKNPHHIREGLINDGYPFDKIARTRLSDNQLEKLDKILNALYDHENVLVMTNSVEFQAYCLSKFLPVVWALTFNRRVYTTTLLDAYRTLILPSAWDTVNEDGDPIKRLQTCSLLVWTGLEELHKGIRGNSGIFHDLLHVRARNPRAKNSLDYRRTLITFLYRELSKKGGVVDSGGDFQPVKLPQKELPIVLAQRLGHNLGEGLAEFILQDFYLMNAAFTPHQLMMEVV